MTEHEEIKPVATLEHRRPYRELTETERAMGIVALDLIGRWSTWVHRRVESVTFEDPPVLRRRVSVDFTIPASLPAPLPPLNGEPIYAVPLSLLRKRRLRRFNLIDERGVALPLLTAGKNGAVAAGLLWEATTVLLENPPAFPLSTAVREELWEIANRSPEAAIRVWSHLGDTAADREETAWRRALAANENFMALANDIGRNFLVLVPLATRPLQRRVVKFAYDEYPAFPKPAPTVRSKPRRQRRAERKQRRAAHRTGTEGVGMLHVHASVRADDTWAQDPVGDILIRVARSDGIVLDEQRTNASGHAAFQLPVGDYIISHKAPPGLVAEDQEQRQSVSVSADPASLTLRYLRFATLERDYQLDAPRQSRRLRIGRWTGRRSERVVILLPAIGQCASFHMELEAPEGLKVTTGRLESRRSYSTAEKPSVDDLQPDIEALSVQRVHLHKDDALPDQSGTAVVHIRPRPQTIIRAGTIAAAVVMLLLGAIGFDLKHIGTNVGAAATLLLLIPGGLSAWVVRPREEPATTRLLARLRFVASTSGLWGIVGAVLIVVSQKWGTDPTTHAVLPLGPQKYLSACFDVLLFLSFVTLIIMLTAWRCVQRPPEQRKWAAVLADLNED